MSERDEKSWQQIIHNDCGLPVERCICPTATMIHHDCEICDGEGQVTELSPNKGNKEECPKCEGMGEYFVITGDVSPIEIKGDENDKNTL